MKGHSDPNEVSLVRWSEWRFAGPIWRAYWQGSKQRTYDDHTEFYVGMCCLKKKKKLLICELYIPPKVCNCRCVDASSVAYTDVRIFTCESRSSSGSTQSVHLSASPYATPLGCLVCVRSVIPKVFVQFYSNFAMNGCSHIEDVHYPFCAHFMNIFSFLRGVELRQFSDQKCLDGVWNSNNFYSFIFKLFIRMIVYKIDFRILNKELWRAFKLDQLSL